MRTITRDELMKLEDRDDDYVLINVLDADSFREKHIPGSINAWEDDDRFVEKVRRQVRNEDRTVVVYCGGPKCEASRRAADKLEHAGFTNVFRYRGGLSDWESALRLDSEKATAR